MNQNRRWLGPTRIALMWVSVVSTAALLTTVLYRYVSIGDLSTLPSLRWNELVNAAIQVQLDESRTLFQVLLLVVAALLGLLIAKSDEAGLLLSDTAEIVTLVCAALLLIGSIIFHLLFLGQVQAAYLDGGTLRGASVLSLPDPLSSRVYALFRSQRDCLILGSLVAFFTLFSAHKLRE